MPRTGVPVATSATATATSEAATGWSRTGARCTTPSCVAPSVMDLRNSKNCVAWTIEYGTGELVMRSSCAIFARK